MCSVSWKKLTDVKQVCRRTTRYLTLLRATTRPCSESPPPRTASRPPRHSPTRSTAITRPRPPPPPPPPSPLSPTTSTMHRSPRGSGLWSRGRCSLLAVNLHLEVSFVPDIPIGQVVVRGRYMYDVANIGGDVLLTVEGEVGCCEILPYKICTPGGSQIGTIERVERVKNRVIFPMDMDIRCKALLLATTVFITWVTTSNTQLLFTTRTRCPCPPSAVPSPSRTNNRLNTACLTTALLVLRNYTDCVMLVNWS
ncbi:uncharacterized protein LOC122246155 isoform X3 [Penaeus japonicus]|uniref:uncharacterized protein LOC122246155 isoform X3 n=1 Tax=Penaeus japonicus TaxID=27405 RepID=UPI001C70CCDB|nr:uncharacterized protein LOC122246155 isoform X3 [Penaeus japonicus]